MRKAIVALAAFGLLATTGLTACTDDDGANAGDSGPKAGGGTGEGKVGVILPDTTTSQRWRDDDPKFLKEAFDAAGVPVDIQNAEGDKARFVSIADSMIHFVCPSWARRWDALTRANADVGTSARR